MAHLITTLGPKEAGALGMILPHEHIYVDMEASERDGKRDVDAADVVGLMAPEVKKARAEGISALVDATPVGVGRRVDLVKAVSEATNFPIVVPTGIYREPWVPQWAYDASVAELEEWMLGELQDGIAETGVRAAWIKLSAGDEGLRPVEIKILRAAAHAAAATGAVIGSHTIKGEVALRQMDILEEEGYTPERFIWIHTQNEEEFSLHLEAVQRGAWVEYDAIGGGRTDEFYLTLIQMMLDAGMGEHVLLSQDRGWYDPAQPNGGTPRPFTYLTDIFLPKLRMVGVDGESIRLLTHDNPFRAFSR